MLFTNGITSMLLSTALPLLTLAQETTLRPSPPSQTSTCKPMTFSISTSANNRLLLNPPPDLYSNISQIIEFLTQDNGHYAISGTYKITAQYCVPKKQHPRYKAPLMLFVHGNTYDKDYWRGWGMREGGDWIGYATEQGYHTLALDRLGSGGSGKADPVAEVQAPLQVAILNELIQTQAKKNGFDKTVFVGHSYGAILATQLAHLHPKAVDSYVLTGIAKEAAGDNPLPRQLASVYMQASVYDPQRFPPEIYTPGYLVPTVKAQRADTFYSDPKSDFSSPLFDHDFTVKDIMTLGEAATQTKHVAEEYTGRVFVTSGVADAVFCGNGTYVEANCERKVPNQLDDFVTTYFPKVSTWRTFVQQQAGHCALQHYSWKDAVIATHKWLDGPKLPGPSKM